MAKKTAAQIGDEIEYYTPIIFRWFIQQVRRVTPKKSLLTAGVALLGTIGTQQVMLNSHQLRLNSYLDACMDYNLAWYAKDWDEKDPRRQLERVTFKCD